MISWKWWHHALYVTYIVALLLAFPWGFEVCRMVCHMGWYMIENDTNAMAILV